MNDRFSMTFGSQSYSVEIELDLVNWQDDKNIRVGAKEFKALCNGNYLLFNILVQEESSVEAFTQYFAHILLPAKEKARLQELEQILQSVFIPQINDLKQAIAKNTLCDWIPDKYRVAILS